MNILYLHGLNSNLSAEKRKILERFGTVQSPSIAYNTYPDRIEWLNAIYKNKEIDIIIGSSMGGFAGYHLSKLFRVPALVFNPALAERSVSQHVPKTPVTNGSSIHIVLGGKDSVINPEKTLNLLGELLYQPQDYKISIRHDLEHRIPITVFKEEVMSFFKPLTTK